VLCRGKGFVRAATGRAGWSSWCEVAAGIAWDEDGSRINRRLMCSPSRTMNTVCARRTLKTWGRFSPLRLNVEASRGVVAVAGSSGARSEGPQAEPSKGCLERWEGLKSAALNRLRVKFVARVVETSVKAPKARGCDLRGKQFVVAASAMPETVTVVGWRSGRAEPNRGGGQATPRLAGASGSPATQGPTWPARKAETAKPHSSSSRRSVPEWDETTETQPRSKHACQVVKDVCCKSQSLCTVHTVQ